MIFRTITDDITGANKSIGLFVKSLDFKGIINSFKQNGFVSTLFNTPLINIDTDAIDDYNTAIKSGIPFEKALAKDVVKYYSYSRDKNILFQASNVKDDDKIHFLLFQLALYHYYLQSKYKYIFHHVLQLHFQFCSYLFWNL